MGNVGDWVGKYGTAPACLSGSTAAEPSEVRRKGSGGQVRSSVFFCVIAGTLASQQATAQDNEQSRSSVVTQEQYRCLLQHRDELVVSRRGTVLDLGECPPTPVLGAFPQRFSERYLLLSPEDVQCLRKIRPGDRSIAVERDDAKVELFLRPCGES